MQVQFIKPWSIYRSGAIIQMPGGQADMLIRRKFVREYVAPQPDATTTTKARRKTRRGTSDN